MSKWLYWMSIAQFLIGFIAMPWFRVEVVPIFLAAIYLLLLSDRSAK